jgi:hypothetical protein
MGACSAKVKTPLLGSDSTCLAVGIGNLTAVLSLEESFLQSKSFGLRDAQ